MPKKGYKQTKEHKEKISKNNVCYWLGKHRSEESKQKMSNTLKGNRHSEESKKKMSESHKGQKAWGKGLTKETDERLKKTSISIIRHHQTHPGPFTNTKPELKMKDILNDLNIPFEHQFRLGNHLYDFHIPNTNILIEVDGDYWHGNPKKFKKLNKIQQKIKQRDIKHNKIAKNNNFVLLRFWENDILNNEERVKTKLEEIK